MIGAAKITIILIFENKNRLVVRSITIKEEMNNVMFWSKKDISKVKNTLHQWILQNILENQEFQRIGKFIMVNFYEMDFMKGIVMLVKADHMYNILSSDNHYLLFKRWRWNWRMKVFRGVCSWMSIHLLHPSFSEGQASARERYSCREMVWYCNIDDTGAR